jgi:hypothetical protein
MIITSEQLKELLAEAFDAGWYGSKDMKDAVVEELAEKVEKQPSLDNPWVKMDDFRIKPDYPTLEEREVINYSSSLEENHYEEMRGVDVIREWALESALEPSNINSALEPNPNEFGTRISER